MSVSMDDGVKRWTAKRKTALVIEIIQGKTTVAEASRSFDLSPSEIEGWVDDAKRGMENSLRANPLDIREQYEKQLKDLQEAYGEAMLELRARKKFQALLDAQDEKCPQHSSGPTRGRICRAADEALRLVRRAVAHGLLSADQGNDPEQFLVRLPHRCLVAGLQQEHSPVRLPAQGLAGPQAGARHAAADRGDPLGGRRAERTLVDRYVPGLGRARWLDHPCPRHRLPRARTARLAGQLAVQIAKYLGASKVIATGRN